MQPLLVRLDFDHLAVLKRPPHVRPATKPPLPYSCLYCSGGGVYTQSALLHGFCSSTSRATFHRVGNTPFFNARLNTMSSIPDWPYVRWSTHCSVSRLDRVPSWLWHALSPLLCRSLPPSTVVAPSRLPGV